MSKMNVAELLVETLYQAGVRRIYGVVGDSLNAVTEALRKHGDIDWIHTRHEEVAAFAAGGEAHLTGSLAVCAGSCGPGNLHLINGLFDCHRSRVPVLAIAAQIPSAEIGRSRRPEWRDARYAVFQTGPSATADIEGVLIHGAQVVRSLSVAPVRQHARPWLTAGTWGTTGVTC